MDLHPALVGALFAAHGIREPWAPLRATGVANHIYATRDVVLRVATDCADAIPDARTESVAAPAARAAGILTPRLIAFDDSRALVDRPFSLWERVHGETLGLMRPDPARTAETWRQVGRELARLHHRVTECPDPDGYLDTPGRPLDLDPLIHRLVDAGRVNRAMAAKIARLVDELAPRVVVGQNVRFIHDDIHPMNVMCSPAGELLALIDWGDAGWADAALDFAAIPLHHLAHAVEGYEAETPGALGEDPAARLVWDKLHYALDDACDDPSAPPPRLDALRRFLDGFGGAAA